MLFGQNFGGRHYGHLCSGFDGGECGKCGDDGFSAAYVALQQAVHGKGLRHVLADFGYGALLCAGEGEGQGVAQGLAERAVADQRHGLAADTLLPRQPHGELLRQKFVKLEPLPRGQGAV